MRYLIVLVLLVGCATMPDMSDVELAHDQEAKSYSALLQSKMQRGEMTEEEARYLWEMKVNDIMERWNRVYRERAERAASAYRRAFDRTQTTDCRPDGLGGVRCVTR